MSHLTQWFLHTNGIHVTTANLTNHKSLLAAHGIRSLASILMKHLKGLGDDWPLYCKPAMSVYNSYATLNLDNLSPFEVDLGRKAVLAPRFEYKPKIPITGTHAKAQENLQERLSYFRKRLEGFRSNRMAIMNKDRQHNGFTVGHIVYMYMYGMVVEEARLKPGLIPTHKEPARTMSELKNAAKFVYTSNP